jgi:hypothetical protein
MRAYVILRETGKRRPAWLKAGNLGGKKVSGVGPRGQGEPAALVPGITFQPGRDSLTR